MKGIVSTPSRGEKKDEQVRLMFSMGELTHEGGFGCLFVICCREKMVERMWLWSSWKGGRVGGDTTEQRCTEWW